jgi:hypothetical protein
MMEPVLISIHVVGCVWLDGKTVLVHVRVKMKESFERDAVFLCYLVAGLVVHVGVRFRIIAANGITDLDTSLSPGNWLAIISEDDTEK